MSRFRTTQSFYCDAVGVGHVKAGSTVCDNQVLSVSGDVIWSGLTSQSLPPGFVPLDPAAVALKAASPLANEIIRCCITGTDSVA
jgi:hypothetical protein